MVFVVFDPVSRRDRAVLVGLVLPGVISARVCLGHVHYLAVLLFNHCFCLIQLIFSVLFQI